MASPSLRNEAANADSNGTVGVQQLIDRLKSEGIQEGKQQADALLAVAKKEAVAIIESAHAEAETILRDAQRQAQRTEDNGKQALALASRDASLQLKEHLEREFRGWIGALVQKQLDAPEFLSKVILEMAGECREVVGKSAIDREPPSANKISVLVSSSDTDKTSAAHALKAFVNAQAVAMFGEGVFVQFDPSVRHGFRMRLDGKHVEINFTDEAVTTALMRFLAPEFRQLIGSIAQEPV
jgi:V/A-type H+-transporting ATPase subunit E